MASKVAIFNVLSYLLPHILPWEVGRKLSVGIGPISQDRNEPGRPRVSLDVTIVAKALASFSPDTAPPNLKMTALDKVVPLLAGCVQSYRLSMQVTDHMFKEHATREAAHVCV